MATFFSYENVKQFVIYCAFGTFIGLDLWWIGYAVTAGVKWVIRKIKARKEKKNTTKEENTNE